MTANVPAIWIAVHSCVHLMKSVALIHSRSSPLILKGENVTMAVLIGGMQSASEPPSKDVFKRVGQALSKAKEMGRNRVCLASGDSSCRLSTGKKKPADK